MKKTGLMEQITFY